MLREAFEYLVKVGNDSAPKVVRTEAEPPHIYFIRNGDRLEKAVAAPHPAKHAAFSLQAIVEKARENTPQAEVWYHPGAVVLIFGDALRETATFDLQHSDPFKVLAHWKANKPAIDQAGLVRELRTTFRDCIGRMGELVESLRKVNFRATSSIDGEVGHGKASLGKQITGEVTGLKVIPEYITFDLPVYANPSLRAIRAAVECALEPDTANGNFRVIPLPGQLEAAVDTAMAAIAAQLAEELGQSDTSLFYGKP